MRYGSWPQAALVMGEKCKLQQSAYRVRAVPLTPTVMLGMCVAFVIGE